MILCLPTGAGKTVVVSNMMQTAEAKGLSAIFFAHRQELVEQCSRKLSDLGVPHGIIAAGQRTALYHRIQVASKDTVYSRAVRRGTLELPHADLVVADEAHRSISATWAKLLKHYRDSGATVIGLTATPARGDGRGLGEFYQDIICGVTYEELIQAGYLVPTRVFAPYKPNLKGVAVTAGDYNQRQLGARMDKPGLVGDIYDTWAPLGWDRPTIAFAASIDHSHHIRDVFLSHGIKAAHLDGKTPDEERKELNRQFMSGDIQVICNVGVFTEGIDLPPASCCILARPTRSVVLFRQMCGRVMRPYPEKQDAIILDHAGAIYQHGFPGADIEWSLDPTSNVSDSIERQKQEKPERQPIVCPKCHCAFSGTSTCPSCGEMLPDKKGRDKQAQEGVLAELSKDGMYVNPEEALRKKEWNSALGVAANRNGTFRMAKKLFHQKTGQWPPDSYLPSDRESWDKKVKDVMPGYVRRKATQHCAARLFT